MIGGKIKENSSNNLFIGLGTYNVIAVNPTKEELSELTNLSYEDKEKMFEYSYMRDGFRSARIDFWGQEEKTKKLQKVSIFISEKDRVNKDGTRMQYIDNVGMTTWAATELDLPSWFTERNRPYRIAKDGEETIYKFVTTWASRLDYKDPDTVVQLDFDSLLNGDVSELRSLINSQYVAPFLWLNIVNVKFVENEQGEPIPEYYSSIYSYDFLPKYCLKYFRLVDYDKEEEVTKLMNKQKLEFHERFVLNLKSREKKNFHYSLKEIHTVKPESILLTDSEKIEEDDSPSY